MSRTVTVSATRDPGILSALHKDCFEEAWSADAFSDLLAGADAEAYLATNTVGNHVAFILVRRAADEAEIVSLGVLPDWRRNGVAHALLEHTASSLSAGGVTALFLEVAEDNRAACAFYKTSGFAEIGRRAAYYRRRGNGRVDAIVMQRITNQHPDG